ncbi:cation:proton antiporter family protein [Desulfogranum mediterraneum]|uniref:cation:proton antiporter family protein n=1 Tax=Desulfogranum mediterraneum TaxID=160661 RepID=UPI0004206523|nr:cation:proton antiporter family protein [Desulfogranum mediterraneum]
MDILFIVIAFVLGFLARQLGLPPLVGFLAGGFVLNLMGQEASETLHQLADVGILLLLFSIGLKVQPKRLLQPQVWGSAASHMLLTVIGFTLILQGLGLLGIGCFRDLELSTTLLFAFALSFSSTVFAVKILEEQGEMTSGHGRLAIGILIMQDLFAVLFITFSSGKLPSPLALGLLLLLFVKRPLGKILDRSGHGELLVLLACILPLAGAALFEHVGLKPDLGALILGMLLGGHAKTDELAKAMFGFKDLFLVGFFLTIGMTELPGLEAVLIAALLVLLVPLKSVLFFLLLTRFRLRARTSLLSSLNLSNYSEFGLIVSTIGVTQGWLGSEWLVIIAVAVSFSMVAASPLNSLAPVFYRRWAGLLKRCETRRRLSGEEAVDIGGARVAVLGMGRVGTGAYEQLTDRYGYRVIGLDFDEERVAAHQAAGRAVIQGDAADEIFWQRGIANPGQLSMLFLTMSHPSNLKAAKNIQEALGRESMVIAATARYDDELQALRQGGVERVFYLYGEAGAGFVDHVVEQAEGVEGAEMEASAPEGKESGGR